MSGKDPREHFDPVVQMQLAEFQRHIAGATNSDLVAIIIESNGVAQCATGSPKMGPLEGQGKVTALITQVAAALVKDGSHDEFELLLRNKKTGETLDCGQNMDALVVKV